MGTAILRIRLKPYNPMGCGESGSRLVKLARSPGVISLPIRSGVPHDRLGFRGGFSNAVMLCDEESASFLVFLQSAVVSRQRARQPTVSTICSANRCPLLGPLVIFRDIHCGEVSERLKEPASKAGSLVKPGSWVQIPPSPPFLRCSIQCFGARAFRVPLTCLSQRPPHNFQSNSQSGSSPVRSRPTSRESAGSSLK